MHAPFYSCLLVCIQQRQRKREKGKKEEEGEKKEEGKREREKKWREGRYGGIRRVARPHIAEENHWNLFYRISLFRN
jgi:hypothetical protein